MEKAKSIDDKLNTAAGLKAFMIHSAEARMIRTYFADRMRKCISNETIYSQLLPDFAVGCRRLTPGNPYMKAVQEPNVKIHRCAAERVTPRSIVGSNGDEIEVDTIICATGFDVSFKPRYRLIGRNGVSLQEKWNTVPEGYLSLAIPDMPNYFTVMGPSFPIANGSVMGALQGSCKYILKMIQKIQRERIHSVAPKQSVTDAFNEHTQAWVAGAAWSDPRCRSWYRDEKTGRVNAIWPGGSLHFLEAVKEPRYEDFEIKYDSKVNMFEFFGLGFTKNMITNEADLSHYISLAELDERFVHFKPDVDSENEHVRRMSEMVHEGPPQ